MRLDLYLVQNGLADTRQRAQGYIVQGRVKVNGHNISKPAHPVLEGDQVLVDKPAKEYVSRAAHKLLHGLEVFAFSSQDRVALDIGASTGGFTQVLLEGGAQKVYAVEVGHGQLHPSLQQHPAIVLRENTHAKNLDSALIPEAPQCIVCDVSFISLKPVLPAALALAADGAWLVALIKPQFEVGKDNIGKRGIVKDVALHEAVCEDIKIWLAGQPGWQVVGVAESPIVGQDGNREFLIGAVFHG